MQDPENSNTQGTQTSTHTRTIEERRNLLQHAAISHAHDPRVMPALLATFSPDHIRFATQRGIYIGYSRNDEIFALELTTDLREQDIPVWMDTLDVAEGEDWRAALRAAQKRCGLMLLVASPAALADPDLMHEMRQFRDSGKIVIPALHEACDVSELTLYVDPINFHDNYRSGLKTLIKLLRRSRQAQA